LSVEAFDIGILDRSARPNEVELDTVAVGPGVHLTGEEHLNTQHFVQETGACFNFDSLYGADRIVR
jgi:hypothetical protein